MQTRTRIILLALAVVALSGPAARADVVDFETLGVGATYGQPVGGSPGDLIFSEDGTDVVITNFWSGGNPYFGLAEVQPSIGSPAFFHDGNIMNTNNVGLIFTFSGEGDASFEFLDYGGTVNLRVNGSGPVMGAADMADLAGTVAPGVTMTVSVTAFPGGHKGTAVLTGPVTSLQIGGQEFWLDDVTGGGDNGNPTPNPEDCDRAVTHQSLNAGDGWGSSNGQSPGDFIFSEDGIPVHVEEFRWPSGSAFGDCKVAIPGVSGFGDDKVMQINNINNRYAIQSLGINTSKVSFEYLNEGGFQNLQVNGSTLHVDHLPDMPATVAPGVTMSVQTWPAGVGERGFVELVGNIWQLMVGGQEFSVDNLCVTEDLMPTDCDFAVNHQSLNLGDSWGDGQGNNSGDFMFSEDGIHVFAEYFHWPSGGTFGNCRVQATPTSDFGFDQVMAFNNINNYYDMTGLSGTVASVSFEYLNYGGFQNLQVNGENTFVDDLAAMPSSVAGGVTLSVQTWAVPGGERGLVKLSGDVKKLVVGGQEFFLDNLCVEQGSTPLPDICAHVVDNESQVPGTAWGDDHGQSPGEVIFDEDGIEVAVHVFDTGTGEAFGEATITPPARSSITGNAMWLNNITVGFLLSGVQPVNHAQFDFSDCGGLENLFINDERYVGELSAVPAGYFHGVSVTVLPGGFSGGCQRGTIVIEGDIQRVGVGGQELQIDNFCVGFEGTSAAPEDLLRAGLRLRGNHPNPFNPTTTVSFSVERDGPVELAVYNLAGQRVKTLLEGFVQAGEHAVLWNGRDQSGRVAAAGVYFVQLRDGSQVVSRKITMVK